MHFLISGELVSITFYLHSSSKHFSPPYTNQVSEQTRKTVTERRSFTLLQLPGRLETGSSAPCPGPHMSGCEPQHQHHQKTQTYERSLYHFPFCILFCEPGILTVVKFKKDSSLTLQHLNFSKYF